MSPYNLFIFKLLMFKTLDLGLYLTWKSCLAVCPSVTYISDTLTKQIIFISITTCIYFDNYQ